MNTNNKPLNQFLERKNEFRLFKICVFNTSDGPQAPGAALIVKPRRNNFKFMNLNPPQILETLHAKFVPVRYENPYCLPKFLQHSTRSAARTLDTFYDIRGGGLFHVSSLILSDRNVVRQIATISSC